MIEQTPAITDFLKKHYSPGDLESAPEELHLSTNEVLQLIFTVFPEGCIDDYDLIAILTTLGYEARKKSAVIFVWCFNEIE